MTIEMKWYITPGSEEPMYIEVDKNVDSNGVIFYTNPDEESYELFPDNRLGDSKEEVFKKQMMAARAAAMYWRSKLPLYDQGQMGYLQNCGRHMISIEFGEPAKKCEICNDKD